MTAAPEPVYLVEGSDPALVAEAVSSLVSELVGDEERALAVEDYGGEEVDLASVADSCATPALLVSRRVVVVRDVGGFNADEAAPLVAYLQDPLPSTALVLVAGGGTIPAKLAAAAKAKGRVVSTTVSSRQASEWLRERVRASGLLLDRSAEEVLLGHLGEDLSRLLAILAVLRAAYEPGTRLGPDDLEPYLGTAGSVTPWAFTDAIDAGDVGSAIDLMHRLLEGGERHPLVVLAIIARHVQSLLRVDGPSIRTEAQAAAAMGIAAGRSTFPAKKALRSAQQWGSANIAEAVSLVADAEIDLKGVSAWPPEAVLEVLVGRLCRLARSRQAVRSQAR